MMGHFFREKKTLYKHIAANNTVFHLNIRCHWWNDILKYLDLKNSVMSLCCDLYESNFHLRFNIKFVAEYTGNLKNLVICNLYHPLGKIETVLKYAVTRKSLY